MTNRTTGLSPAFGLRREIDRLFEDAFGGRGLGGGESSWAPAVDIRENQQEIALDIELPGIDPQNVDVSVENGVLTVRGEKREERKESDERDRYHLVERSYGTFIRSFQLPQGIDEEQIAADFQHGLLRVRIPKAALPQPRKIQIGSQQQRQMGSGSQGNVQGPGASRGRSSGGRGNGGNTEGSGTRRDPMAASGSEGTETGRS